MIKNDAPQPAPAEAVAAVAAPAEAVVAAAPVAVPAAGAPTLHDFCLDLLTDSAAMKAFEADPTGVLSHAGLTGITPEDVRDVLPLVTDLVPADVPGVSVPQGGDSFGGGYELPFGSAQTGGYYEYGADGFKGGTEQSVTSSVSEVWSASHVEAGPRSAHIGDAAQISSVLGEGGGSTGVDVSKGGLDVNGDAVVTSVAGSAAGEGTVAIGTDGIHIGAGGGLETPLGVFGTAGAVNLDQHGLTVNADATTPYGGADSGLYLGPEHETGGPLYGGVDLDGPLDKTVSLTTLDGAGLNQDLLPSLSGDITHLPTKAVTDPTAITGALLGAVPQLPAVPGLPQLPLSDVKLPSPDLPVDLPAVPALPTLPTAVPQLPTEQVTHTVGTVQHTVGTVTDTVTSTVSHVPAVEAPVVPHAPALPKLDLPKLDLPKVDLPKLDVPNVDLPKLPGADAAHGAGGTGGVGGLLDHNPVSDVVDGVTDGLHLGL